MRLSLVVVSLVLSTQAFGKGSEVTFRTSDGVTVHGDLYEAPGLERSAPLILLFHQGGGDARGEYRPLVGRLLNAGYHALAIDQRLGGERFGQQNRTVAGLEQGYDSYCDAYPDLVAALRFARRENFSGPLIAWGSSYSAALAIRLAAEHGESLVAVLAFSPASGEPMKGCNPEPFAKQLDVPLLALRPVGEMEVPSVPVQLAAFREMGHETYVADPGVHGSSMLNAGRVGAGTDKTWDVVLAFIAASLEKGRR